MYDYYVSDSFVSVFVVYCNMLVVDGCFVVDFDFGDIFYESNLWFEICVCFFVGGGGCNVVLNFGGFIVFMLC